MSERSRRRRARAEALPLESTAPRTKRRLPPLPILAAITGLALLAVAWTTRWQPGAPAAVGDATRFTLDIPADRQRVINSWPRFFVCYDLLDPAVVDLTLRANQRATGTLDFPVEKVIVELPATSARGESERPASGAEEELIEVRRSVLDTAVPERLAALRRECGG